MLLQAITPSLTSWGGFTFTWVECNYTFSLGGREGGVSGGKFEKCTRHACCSYAVSAPVLRIPEYAHGQV